jgi:hypothetical protein
MRTGWGSLVVPGTLRDSLFILDAIHNRDGGPRPDCRALVAEASAAQPAAQQLVDATQPVAAGEFDQCLGAGSGAGAREHGEGREC